jgi:hypothetical protein
MFISATIMDAITDFVAYVNKMSDEHYTKNYPILDKPKFVAEPCRKSGFASIARNCVMVLQDCQRLLFRLHHGLSDQGPWCAEIW